MGVTPTWGYSSNWGYGPPSGGLGLLLSGASRRSQRLGRGGHRGPARARRGIAGCGKKTKCGSSAKLSLFYRTIMHWPISSASPSLP
ncbi:DUF3309 family protein [Nitrosospira sp. Nsp2]|uniref:DUF3309 family protein n=1 Tax=Nitrosospira sp. Nsp2 TaxID=136548 RepID=UPI000D317FE5|nr:DUF3309 family protein [Nitrosospira sp. Nsp2]